MLEDLGADIINCDKIGHEIYCKGKPCHTRLVQAFGEQILANDGEINRKVLGPIVFNSAVSSLFLLYFPIGIFFLLGRNGEAKFFGLASHA